MKNNEQMENIMNNCRSFKKNRCSYQCPYYQDGSVSSLCNKYNNKVLVYDGYVINITIKFLFMMVKFHLLDVKSAGWKLRNRTLKTKK